MPNLPKFCIVWLKVPPFILFGYNSSSQLMGSCGYQWELTMIGSWLKNFIGCICTSAKITRDFSANNNSNGVLYSLKQIQKRIKQYMHSYSFPIIMKFLDGKWIKNQILSHTHTHTLLTTIHILTTHTTHTHTHYTNYTTHAHTLHHILLTSCTTCSENTSLPAESWR